MATGSAATCSACASASPPGARFCMQCGAPLARGCASCGSALPELARFCPSCGAASSAPTETTRPASERSPRAYTPKHRADEILASRAAALGHMHESPHHLREAHRLHVAMGAHGHAARLANELGL